MSYRIADSFTPEILSFEERQQIALTAMVEALRTYNRRRSPNEGAWVYMKAKGAVCDAIRKEFRRRRHEQPVDDEILNTTTVSTKTPLDAMICAEEAEGEDKRLIAFRQALRSLEPRIQEIVRRIGLNEESQQKVADEMGISQSWCSRLYKAGLDEIRYAMEFGLDVGYPEIDELTT